MNTCTPRYRIPLMMSIKRSIIVGLFTLRIFPWYSSFHGACHQFVYLNTKVKWAKFDTFICRARNEFCAKFNLSNKLCMRHQRKNLWKWLILIFRTFKSCFSQSLALQTIRKVNKVSWPRKNAFLREESLEFLLQEKKKKKKKRFDWLCNFRFEAHSAFRKAIFFCICAKNCLFWTKIILYYVNAKPFISAENFRTNCSTCRQIACSQASRQIDSSIIWSSWNFSKPPPNILNEKFSPPLPPFSVLVKLRTTHT